MALYDNIAHSTGVIISFGRPNAFKSGYVCGAFSLMIYIKSASLPLFLISVTVNVFQIGYICLSVCKEQNNQFVPSSYLF